jgi:hypothetical protein
MNITLVAATLAGVLGFGGAWYLQDLRMDSNENDRLTAQAASQRELYVLGQKRSFDVIVAQNARLPREARIRADAADLRSVAGGLRSDRASAFAAVGATAPACTEPASASGQLLRLYEDFAGESAAALVGLSEAADRHVSDIQALIEICAPEI